MNIQELKEHCEKTLHIKKYCSKQVIEEHQLVLDMINKLEHIKNLPTIEIDCPNCYGHPECLECKNTGKIKVIKYSELGVGE
jgi:hypothetical protein